MDANSSPEAAQVLNAPSNESSNISCGGSCSDKEMDNMHNSGKVSFVPSTSTTEKKPGRKRKRFDLKGGGNGDTPRPEKLPERKITEYIKVRHL